MVIFILEYINSDDADTDSFPLPCYPDVNGYLKGEFHFPQRLCCKSEQSQWTYRILMKWWLRLN